MSDPADVEENVVRGTVVRTAAMLLAPELELGVDRQRLAEILRGLGLDPYASWYSIDGVEGLGRARDEYAELFLADDGFWTIGYHERGQLSIRGKFSIEADACRQFGWNIISHAATTMGFRGQTAHATQAFRERLLEALRQAIAFIETPQPDPIPLTEEERKRSRSLMKEQLRKLEDELERRRARGELQDT